jgi:hypothetical protein
MGMGRGMVLDLGDFTMDLNTPRLYQCLGAIKPGVAIRAIKLGVA